MRRQEARAARRVCPNDNINHSKRIRLIMSKLSKYLINQTNRRTRITARNGLHAQSGHNFGFPFVGGFVSCF